MHYRPPTANSGGTRPPPVVYAPGLLRDLCVRDQCSRTVASVKAKLHLMLRPYYILTGVRIAYRVRKTVPCGWTSNECCISVKLHIRDGQTPRIFFVRPFVTSHSDVDGVTAAIAVDVAAVRVCPSVRSFVVCHGRPSYGGINRNASI